MVDALVGIVGSVEVARTGSDALEAGGEPERPAPRRPRMPNLALESGRGKEKPDLAVEEAEAPKADADDKPDDVQLPDKEAKSDTARRPEDAIPLTEEEERQLKRW